MQSKQPGKTSTADTQTTVAPRQEPGVKAQPGSVQPDDWLCAVCKNKIASDKQRFFYDDSSEFEFSNPSGHLFHIITFSQTLGCRESGAPTREFTWFEGHAWTISQCSQCGLQLGWRYTGKYRFYGLIRAHMMPGFSAFN